MTILLVVLILSYAIVIGILAYGFDKIEVFNLQDLKPQTTFTVVIPFRNEAENLEQLLNSIFKLNYPKSLFEVVLVDDDSNDASVKIINRYILKKTIDYAQSDIKIIKNKRSSNSPKKDAITCAIAIAKHDWIITTDADCIVPKYWLDAFDELTQTQQPNCIAAPVTYKTTTSFFKRFQTLDFLSLQGATIGGFGLQQPFLANGANFGYKLSAFKDVKGFTGNENIASGDDIFLLEKLKQYNPKKVAYLKSNAATVVTKPVRNFKNLVEQRLRWASKTSKNPNGFSKLIGLLIFLGNLVGVALLPLLVFQYITLKTAFYIWVIKLSIDFLLLFKTVRFFKQETVLLSYITSAVLYPFFCVYIVVLSAFKSYRWKDRTYRK